MRTIKFRAQRVDNKEFVYGFYWVTPIATYITADAETKHQDIPVIPETIGQYAGIKDMEGNEIYEGDILRKFDGKKYVILWDSGDAGFVSVDLKEYILKPESRLDERDLVWVVCEVIGNIHENPELLK